MTDTTAPTESRRFLKSFLICGVVLSLYQFRGMIDGPGLVWAVLSGLFGGSVAWAGLCRWLTPWREACAAKATL